MMNKPKKLFTITAYFFFINIILCAVLAIIISDDTVNGIIGTYFGITELISITLLIVFGIASIITSFKNKENNISNFKNTLKCKIVFIPFYIVLTILIIFSIIFFSQSNGVEQTELSSFLGAFFVTIIYIFIMVVLVFSVFCAIVLVFVTSLDNILLLIKIRKKTGILFMLIHILLNLIFIIDIIDSIYLSHHFSKEEEIVQNSDGSLEVNNEK